MSETFTYAALGDSTGVGVGASDGRGYVAHLYERLARKVPHAKLANLCVSGATSEGVLREQLSRARSARPAVVTLFVGGNDLWRGVTPGRFSAHVHTIVAGLRGTGAPVSVATLPNLAHAPLAALAGPLIGLEVSAIEDRVRAFNHEILRAAQAHECSVADLFSVGIADAAHYFSHDGFHPSSLGYARFAEVAWPALERSVEAALGLRKEPATPSTR